jgi:hypothetical protein
MDKSDATSPGSDRHRASLGSQDGTDNTSRQQPHHPDAATERPKLLDVSMPQLFGGALAAMTAAVIGSRLGVAGTVVGAALASICAAVLGSVYTASIQRTHQLARIALSKTPGRGARATQLPASITLRETDATPHRSAQRVDGSPEPDEPVSPAGRRPRSRRLVISSLIGGIAVFVIAFGAIAGIELATGRTLDGQHGTTTASELVHRTQSHRPGHDASKKSDDPAGSSDGGSASPQPHSSASDQDPSSADQPSSQPTGVADPSGSSTSESTDAPSDNQSTDSDPSAQSSSGQDSSGTGSTGQASNSSTAGSSSSTSGSSEGSSQSGGSGS